MDCLQKLCNECLLNDNHDKNHLISKLGEIDIDCLYTLQDDYNFLNKFSEHINDTLPKKIEEKISLLLLGKNQQIQFFHRPPRS